MNTKEHLMELQTLEEKVCQLKESTDSKEAEWLRAFFSFYFFLGRVFLFLLLFCYPFTFLPFCYFFLINVDTSALLTGYFYLLLSQFCCFLVSLVAVSSGVSCSLCHPISPYASSLPLFTLLRPTRYSCQHVCLFVCLCLCIHTLMLFSHHNGDSTTNEQPHGIIQVLSALLDWLSGWWAK